MTPRQVRVTQHDPAWKEAFEAEAAALRSVSGKDPLIRDTEEAALYRTRSKGVS